MSPIEYIPNSLAAGGTGEAQAQMDGSGIPGEPQTTHRGLLILPMELRSLPEWQRHPPPDMGTLHRLLTHWGEGLHSPPAALALIAVGIRSDQILANPLAELVGALIRAPGFYVTCSRTRGVVVLPETLLYGGHQVARRIRDTLSTSAGVCLALVADDPTGHPPDQLLQLAQTALEAALLTHLSFVTPQCDPTGLRIFPGAAKEIQWLKPFPELCGLSRQDVFRHAFRAFAHECRRFPWFSLRDRLQVAELASALATEAGLDPQTRDCIRLAGIFLDAGMLRIPAILRSTPTPSSAYLTLLRAHPLDSEKFIVSFGFSHRVLNAIRCHHEHLDGTGYPAGLSGSRIPLEAQLLALVDFYVSERQGDPWKTPASHTRAFMALHERMGTHFNTEWLAPFERVLRKYQGGDLER